MNKVSQWRKGKTTVIITHDILDIPPADFVHVVEAGRIVESGTRTELGNIRGGVFERFMRTSRVLERSPFSESLSGIAEEKSVVASNDEVIKEKQEVESVPSTEAAALNAQLSPRRKTSGWAPEVRFDKPLSRREHHLFEDIPLSPRSTTGARSALPPAPPPKPYKLSLQRRPSRSRSHGVCQHRVRPQRRRRTSRKPLPLLRIFNTVWPSLTLRYRIYLILGGLASLTHAAATPAFSFALAMLLTSFMFSGNSNPLSPSATPVDLRLWSAMILAIALLDAVASFIMQYLLESTSEAWIANQKVQAFEAILEQPREWFDGPRNTPSHLTEILDKCAEEAKGLLARFAVYAFVGSLMTVMGISWACYMCWQLTTVGLLLAPVMYGITRAYSWAADSWEEKCVKVAEEAGMVVGEMVENVATVKILGLEGYFRRRHGEKLRNGVGKGWARGLWAGVGFGAAEGVILVALGEYFF